MNQIKIEKTADGWSAKFRYETEAKDFVKSFGFRFDPSDKTWKTRSMKTAERLAKSLGDKESHVLSAEVSARSELDKQALAMSRGTAPINGITVSSPANLSYSPYQLAMVEWALQRWDSGRDSLICGDEMGIGKTIQGIALFQIIAEKSRDPRFLVICPSSLKLNWEREIRRWDLKGLTIEKISGRKTIDPPEANVVIINYDVLIFHKDWTDNTPWDLVVCDEAHYLKNHKAKRTVAVLGGSSKLKKNEPSRYFSPLPGKKLFMTGTPMINRPIDLWPMLHACDPEDLGEDWYKYVREYSDGHKTRYGWDTSGASNLRKLQVKLRSSCMIRRRASDVLAQLPPIRRQAIVLPSNGNSGLIECEWKAFNDYEQIRSDLKQSRANVGDDMADIIRKLTDKKNSAFADLSEARKLIGMSKCEHTLEHVKDMADSRGKIVVFGWHKDVVAALMDGFESSGFSPVRVTGSDTILKRQESVDSFQNNPDVRIIVLNMEAGGVGITLTGTKQSGFCTSVVFSELDWRPSIMDQAERRVARRGSDESATSILVHHIVLDGSLDATISNRLIEKQAVIDKAIN